jgi:hypothetical protein
MNRGPLIVTIVAIIVLEAVFDFSTSTELVGSILCGDVLAELKDSPALKSVPVVILKTSASGDRGELLALCERPHRQASGPRAVPESGEEHRQLLVAGG